MADNARSTASLFPGVAVRNTANRNKDALGTQRSYQLPQHPSFQNPEHQRYLQDCIQGSGPTPKADKGKRAPRIQLRLRGGQPLDLDPHLCPTNSNGQESWSAHGYLLPLATEGLADPLPSTFQSRLPLRRQDNTKILEYLFYIILRHGLVLRLNYPQPTSFPDVGGGGPLTDKGVLCLHSGHCR